MYIDQLRMVYKKLEPKKIYTYREMKNILCKNQSSTADYILSDLINGGLVEETLHPLLNQRGYRLRQ